jgi:hypothetical protein
LLQLEEKSATFVARIHTDKDLYPSKVTTIDHGFVSKRFSVPLALSGTEFNVNMGVDLNISVEEAFHGKREYSVIVYSRYNAPTIFEVTGYLLNGRVDVFQIQPGKNRLSGNMPVQ